MWAAMHVLQVVPYFAPAWAYGGPPKVMWEEARALVARGHDLEVFTTDVLDETRRADAPRSRVEEGVLVHRFENVSNWLAYHHYRFLPRGFPAALRAAKPDVIHLSEMRHELAIGAWWLARKRDIPLVVSAHGTLPIRTGPKAIARRAYDRRWVLPMVRGATALLAQTAHEAQLYRAFGGRDEQVHLLPLGVDDPPPPTDEPVELGVPHGAPFLLFLGRISPLKGVTRLIRAFGAVADAHPDVHLVIAGRDDAGGLADARAAADATGFANRIAFPGPIYGPARFNAYRRAKAFAIVPTHFEETSLASLEAASVGTPLVVGEEADVPFLDEFGAGFRVAAGGDVRPALDAALGAEHSSAGEGARRMIAERHRWPVVAERLESVMEDGLR
jgi:glycosyltransferase involved in cell wall biosynthesis